MSAIVRIFSTEEAAQNAAAQLAAAGYDDHQALLPSQAAGAPEEAIRTARENGLIPGSSVAVCIASMSQGKALVGVNTPFGGAQAAINIMERAGAVDTETLPVYVKGSPTPLSDAFGLPVLAKFVPSTRLLNGSFKNKTSSFGMPLLSKNQRGPSSSMGMPTLSAAKSKTSSFGMPLLSKKQGGPSSSMGMPTLSAAKSKTSSFGFPLLSSNPAPLSSLLGMATLSKRS